VVPDLLASTAADSPEPGTGQDVDDLFALKGDDP
jgi:hypothetical protein